MSKQGNDKYIQLLNSEKGLEVHAELSSTPQERKLAIGAIWGAAVMTDGVFFATLGPAAGAMMAPYTLGVAGFFHYTFNRAAKNFAAQSEILRFSDNDFHIERAGVKTQIPAFGMKVEFNPEMHKDQRLYVAAQGQREEIASFLGAQERGRLAKLLKEAYTFWLLPDHEKQRQRDEISPS